MSFERFGERRWVLVAIIQCDLDDGCRFVEVERSRRPFETNALNEIEQSFAGNSLENSVKMKRREASDACNVFELQGVVEIRLNVGYGPADSDFVFCSRAISQLLSPLDAQD